METKEEFNFREELRKERIAINTQIKDERVIAHCHTVINKIEDAFDEFIKRLKEELLNKIYHYQMQIKIINQSKDRKYLIKDRHLDRLKLQNRIIALLDFRDRIDEIFGADLI